MRTNWEGRPYCCVPCGRWLKTARIVHEKVQAALLIQKQPALYLIDFL
ncbi:hypothetical protein QG041_07755 [Kingella kingae]|nr:hypothetical protein [Kingella kingae]MBD3613933.1 hypothetical protein [Kingella kingae]MBD3632709.1 hypothetical protein [Kingella kingae]MBD3659561.1 hypothetical protein [Kingella kingae]MDK4531228.1 hypothetical protein [Kingella kingae]MDK4532997.1 hypothetical protein [Kingella kingae]